MMAFFGVLTVYLIYVSILGLLGYRHDIIYLIPFMAGSLGIGLIFGDKIQELWQNYINNELKKELRGK